MFLLQIFALIVLSIFIILLLPYGMRIFAALALYLSIHLALAYPILRLAKNTHLIKFDITLYVNRASLKEAWHETWSLNSISKKRPL